MKIADPDMTATMMNVSLHSDPRPEAMADVPGVCELPLTRAVVQYREVHEVHVPGGRIQDVGLALVLEGRFASSAEAIDLGSAEVKLLDLSHELVVLDWVYEPTLEHVGALLRDAANGDRAELGRFCFQVGMEVLERVGYSSLTRPSLLRIGFRDICRDLDLHEGTSVRLTMGEGRVVRIHMDYESNALLVRTPTSARDAHLEEALYAAFPDHDLRRIVPPSSAAAGGYQVRLGLPLDLDELREQLLGIRNGLLRLVTRFEPKRIAQVATMLETFGDRETLARLRGAHADRPRSIRVTRTQSTGGTVH